MCKSQVTTFSYIPLRVRVCLRYDTIHTRTHSTMLFVCEGKKWCLLKEEKLQK